MKKLKNKIECIVFDLDGTIMDSEKEWKDTSLLLNKKYGINIDNDFRLFCCGRKEKDIVNKMKILYPNINAAAVRQEWINMAENQMTKNGVPLKEGFRELLDFLKRKDVKLGLATGSSRQLVTRDFKLNKLNENEIFEQIVTVQEVKAGKPKPYIYKEICKRLDISAKNCLCIEDSPNGAKAAWRAGLNVVLVPDVFPPTPECRRKCIAILNNLTDVHFFLSNLI